MKKRILSAVMVLSMLISLICIPAQAEFRFADDGSSSTWKWASDYIYEAYEKNIFTGDNYGCFNADKNLTRAEAAVVVLALKGTEVDTENMDSGFPDASNKWYSPYVAAAKTEGITSGDEDGNFRPKDSISRAEFVTMLLAAMEVTVDPDTEYSGFTDADGDWYTPYAAAAWACGLTDGYEDGTFRPDNNITRAEAAVMADAVDIGGEDSENNGDAEIPDETTPAGDTETPEVTAPAEEVETPEETTPAEEPVEENIPEFDVTNPEMYAYACMVNAGFTRAAACGIMGNISCESGWDPDIGNGTYFGLWQLSGEPLKDLYAFCEEYNLDAGTVEGQITWFVNGGYEVATGWFDKNKSEDWMEICPTCIGILKSEELQKQIADAKLQETDPNAVSTGTDRANMCAQLFQVSFERGVCTSSSQIVYCSPYEYRDYFDPYTQSLYQTTTWGPLTVTYGYQLMERRCQRAEAYYEKYSKMTVPEDVTAVFAAEN